jgi:hypothetical protein
MNAEQGWLEELEVATTYSDLQNVFSRMSLETNVETESDSLVAKIDEAIRRIENERARDQAELGQLTSEYEAFKQQQSGVVGWFKRKMPFTETRTHEVQHRDAVNDQTAEILADNFIIARAQILKEKIASPKLRRLGQRPNYWREQLVPCDSVGKIRELGSVLNLLGQEIIAATKFVDMVSVDIEGFSVAKFTSREDQVRKNADLVAAREERQALSDEIQEKADLKSAALVMLKGLLISELSERDADFRNAQGRYELLNQLLEHQPKLIQLAEQHLVSLKADQEVQVELASLPDQRENAMKSLSNLTQSLSETKENQSRMQAELQEPSRLYQLALRDSQEANVCLNASKLLYEAYLAEQSKAAPNGPEVASDQDFEHSVPGVLKEYRRLEKAAEVAGEALRLRAPTFEAAKRAYEDAVQRANTLQVESDAMTLELRKVSERESELQQKARQSLQEVESTQRALRAAVEPFLESAQRTAWSGPMEEAIGCLREFLQGSNVSERLPNSSTFGRPSQYSGAPYDTRSPHGPNKVRIRIDSLQKLIPALKEVQQFGEKEVAALNKQRKASLQRRAQMLFDQSVYSEINLD